LENISKVTQILSKALNISVRLILLLFLGVMIIALALQIPIIQNKIIDQFTQYITKETGYETKISNVRLKWWDAISLKDVLIHDTQDSLMINLNEVYVDFSLKGLFDTENPALDQIQLKKGYVRILRHSGEEYDNLSQFIFALTEVFSPKKVDPKKPSIRFSIHNITLNQTSVDIFNYNQDVMSSGFDYNYLSFKNLVGIADDFYTYKDKVGLKLRQLNGQETTSGIDFQQFRTNFTYCSEFIEFDNLYLKSNQTEIKNYLKFSYDSIQSLSHFNQEVEILAHLDESFLNLKDLKYFSPSIPDFDDVLAISGTLRGTIEHLSSEQLLVRFGMKSALFGEFTIDGLPDIDHTFFEMSLVNSLLDSKDLLPYLTKEAQKEINKFQELRFDTEFSGYLTNFSANGIFRTNIGTIKGKINYQLDQNIPTYNGKVEVTNLDLGSLVEDKENFNRINLTGNIKGTGLTVETAILQVDADIKSAQIRDYNYTNIVTNATYAKDLFRGELKINDPNLKGEVSGVLDIRNGIDSIRMVVKIDTAYLKDLNYVDKKSFVSGKVEIDTKGITLDNIEGIARFKDINLAYEDQNLHVDNFFFQSLFTDEARTISLNSDLLVAGISGNFKIKNLIDDAVALGNQYFEILTNSSSSKKTSAILSNDNYNIDINLNFIDINPIVNLFVPNTSISKNTLIEGAFYRTTDNTIFNFFSSIDSIYYNGNFLFDTNFDFNTSKLNTSNDVLASFYMFSKKQTLNSGLTFNNLSTEAIWANSKIELSYAQYQLLTESYVKINSEIQLFPSHTEISFRPSELKILDKIWNFNPNNLITIKDSNWKIDNVNLSNQDQFVSFNGNISPAPNSELKVEINEFNLDFFNTLSLKSFEGKGNGQLSIVNLLNNPGIKGDLQITDFYINNFLIGDIYTETYYDENGIHLDLNNVRENINVINLEGYLGNAEKGLELTAKLQNTNLSILEPFFSDYVSGLGGTITGNLDIKGSITAPEVIGVGELSGGTFRINYLNTQYTADGNIMFNPNGFNFRELVLKDGNENRARLRGGVTHDRFNNFILDITSNLENFQVLNTTLRDNDLFYGTANATGTLSLFGAANNLDLTARLTSQPNTRIFIPFGSSSSQAQEDFINIINVRDTTRLINIQDQVGKLSINNFRMNFILDITPDAYTEIQIDPRTGENIQGKGRGVLNLNIDTQGNFSMNGNYEITEAKYNFSLYNVIRREFQVEPGGRISWFGDPFEGIMNLRATYQENVSLQSLQNNVNQELEDPQMRRRWPLKVIMDLKGNILSPDIAFDFDFNEFPEGNLQTYISAFKNRIANDEQEKNRQVFSVIMMRSFSPAGQFSGVTNIASSNLSQLISSQLNSFIAQVDQNLEVDLDLASLGQNTLETFQLRVAYTFLDGRLRVTRDGGFTDPRGNADLNSIAGDWQAEYLLTQDGRYRMRIYNRNNFNTFTSLSLSRNVATYGISVSQNLAFNSFGELLDNLKSKKRERLKINDSDDFLRYQFETQEKWTPIPLEGLEEKVIPLLLDEVTLPERNQKKSKR
jgi:hypothetical protein